jgi:hypothetical protein
VLGEGVTVGVTDTEFVGGTPDVLMLGVIVGVKLFVTVIVGVTLMVGVMLTVGVTLGVAGGPPTR